MNKMNALEIDQLQHSPAPRPVRILITGASGFVGRNLIEYFRRHYEVTALVHTQPVNLPGVAEHYSDITNKTLLGKILTRSKPDVVIHTAANKNVRQCEHDPQAAYRINSLGTEAVAQACQAAGSRLIYLSTDLVFSCEHGGYLETDNPAPTTVYGKTKLQGEQLAQQASEHVVIVRSGGLYGPYSPLIRWACQHLNRGKVLEAYTDVVNTPTYVNDLALHLERLFQHTNGVFHISGPDMVSRYDFFKTMAQALDLDASLVRGVEAGEKRHLLLLQPNASLKSQWPMPAGIPRCQSLRDGFQSLKREAVCL